MLDRLVESRADRAPFLGRTCASLAFHAALVGLAVRATAGAAPPPAGPVVDTTIWVTDIDPPHPPAVPPAPGPLPVGPRPPAPDPIAPPDVPTIPIGPLGPDAATRMDPTTFGDDRTAGAPLDIGRAGASRGIDSTGFAADEVDEPVDPLRQPIPRYPAALAAAGIEGHVDVEFVVDTAGRVEAGSVAILSSSHPGFVDPARDAIVAGRFRPARRHGVVVRQLVRQRMTFRIGQ